MTRLANWPWRRIALIGGIGAVLVIVAGILGVKSVIADQLHARYGGHIRFSGWWIGGSSAGLRDLALNEGEAAGSPVWARAERVETDLTLGGLLRGKSSPTRITLVRPQITFRIAEDGRVLTLPPLRSGGGATEVPEVVVRDGRVTIAQEGRPSMVVEPVEARMARADSGDGEALKARTNSPIWGPWTASGRFEPGFASGRVTLTSDGPFQADGQRAAMIPFVPESVWEHLSPRGPLRLRLDVLTGAKASVTTTGDLDGATLLLPTLGLVAERSTGRIVVDGKVVRLEGVRGKAIGGTVGANGTLDFSADPPRFDLTLDLDGVDVAKTPRFWQLADSGIQGRLHGKAHLLVTLGKDGADLTGSEGSARVEGAELGGIPIKGMQLTMKAQGDNLQYEQIGAKAEDGSKPVGWLRPIAPRLLAALLIGLQSPKAEPAQDAKPKAEAAPARKPQEKAGGYPGFHLPKTISTHVEFEDVDLAQVVTKLRSMAIPLPFAVAGRLSLKAQATIPLGSLRQIRAYEFHGDAHLRGASIAGVDLGALVAKLDLKNGVLDLTDLRGRLVDRPAGDPANPPPATDPAPSEGPLPPGGFRGRLRAAIDPPGPAEAHLEGLGLPIGEILAPKLPRPTPISGLVSTRIEARVDVAQLSDPKAWTVSGALNSASIRYRETTLERASTSLSLKAGRLEVPDLAATLGGHPLSGRFALDLGGSEAYQASLDVSDWDLDAALAFIPALPRPAPVGGRVTVRLTAKGTLNPWTVAADGQGILKGFRAGPVALGDVPVRWETGPDQVKVTIRDAKPLGGTLAAEADIPTHDGGTIRGWARLRQADIAAVSALMPGGALTMSGRADADGTFVVRPLAKGDQASVEGDLKLRAPDLTVQGISAQALQAVLKVQGGKIVYDAYVESLGGKIEFKGDVPISSEAPRGARQPEITGEVQAVGFRLDGVWAPLGIGGAAAKLRGLAAVDANLLTHRSHPDLRMRGVAEVRDLRWGDHFPIGQVKGTFTVTPRGWDVEPISGTVLGGMATGSASAVYARDGPEDLKFSMNVERASLKRVLGFVPMLADRLDGTGDLRVAGRMNESLRASGEVIVPSASLIGLPLRELRAPGELEYAPNGDLGALTVRRWEARFAGGRLAGDARFGLGHDHSFATDTQLTQIDLESLLRVLTDARKPASGKVSGKVSVSGRDPERLELYRGRIDLDLDDASLVELPVFQQLDRFLGAARGGIFEDGDLHATIGNRQITVDSLTLEGRLMQLHAVGTVGFDTRLDLIVLVNTNQIIGETGQALAGVFSSTGGRGSGSARFANFLSNRLLKFRVGGTLGSPTVELDPALAVGEGAVGFFAAALKLPLELLR